MDAGSHYRHMAVEAGIGCQAGGMQVLSLEGLAVGEPSDVGQ